MNITIHKLSQQFFCPSFLHDTCSNCRSVLSSWKVRLLCSTWTTYDRSVSSRTLRQRMFTKVGFLKITVSYTQPMSLTNRYVLLYFCCVCWFWKWLRKFLFLPLANLISFMIEYIPFRAFFNPSSERQGLSWHRLTSGIFPIWRQMKFRWLPLLPLLRTRMFMSIITCTSRMDTSIR